jgi:D-tagatose-1,6-bisphosphate aldolase subunit GatZ/KbaZ
VIEAALLNGRKTGATVLIEATCNQVNQFGGYTGMTPADFVGFVGAIADRVNFPRQDLLLGGDHLGPLTWADETPGAAMRKAKDLVQAYVRAGFYKIHLDCSMPCAGEGILPLDRIAKRTAELALAAEQTAAAAGTVCHRQRGPACRRYQGCRVKAHCHPTHGCCPDDRGNS